MTETWLRSIFLNMLDPLGLTLSDITLSSYLDLSKQYLGSRSRNRRTISDWIEKLKSFTDKSNDDCTCIDEPIISRKIEIEYVNGSKYKGESNIFGVNGYGVHTFPNGVTYTGQFANGMFQGRGRMTFEDGTYIKGTWFQGMVTEPDIYLNGEVLIDDDRKYCCMPDRRFNLEKKSPVIEPPDKSILTNEQPTREIPYGYYDVGYGFFEPELNAVFHYDDISKLIRITSKVETDWIIRNCRTNPERIVGPSSDLYEQFVELKTYLFEAPIEGEDTAYSNWSLYDSEKQARLEAVNKLLEKRILPKTLPTSHQMDILEFENDDDQKKFLI